MPSTPAAFPPRQIEARPRYLAVTMTHASGRVYICDGCGKRSFWRRGWVWRWMPREWEPWHDNEAIACSWACMRVAEQKEATLRAEWLIEEARDALEVNSEVLWAFQRLHQVKHVELHPRGFVVFPGSRIAHVLSGQQTIGRETVAEVAFCGRTAERPRKHAEGSVRGTFLHALPHGYRTCRTCRTCQGIKLSITFYE
jgi:hypothetical protein